MWLREAHGLISWFPTLIVWWVPRTFRNSGGSVAAPLAHGPGLRLGPQQNMYKSKKAKFSLASGEETGDESSQKSSGGHSQVFAAMCGSTRRQQWEYRGEIYNRGKNVSPWGQPSNEADWSMKFCRLHPSKFQGGSPEQHGPWDELLWTGAWAGDSIILLACLRLSVFSDILCKAVRNATSVVKVHSKNLQRNLFLCQRRQFQSGI